MFVGKKVNWVSCALAVCAFFILMHVPVFGVEKEGKSASKIALEEAKKYAGITLTCTWEAGLQAQAPYAIAPLFEKETGIKIKVVEVPIEGMHSEPIAAHLAGTQEYDFLDMLPRSMGDFVSSGVIISLDPYLEKYMPQAAIEDYLPHHRELYHDYMGHTYALNDDGDTFVLYYRKDLFSDPQNQADFLNEYGYELTPPKTYKQLEEIATFFTNKYQPELYGLGIPRAKGMPHFWWGGPFISNGGRFFDLQTMKPAINEPAGVKTLQQMIGQNKAMPPGAVTWGYMQQFSAWLAGKLAMTITWPPVARQSEEYGAHSKLMEWVPESKVVGKVGYALEPGRFSSITSGHMLAITSNSPHKEAAYLFMQWLNSPDISLQVTTLPFALRDPFRVSHIESPLYRNLWDNADEYLDTLRKGGKRGVIELTIPGAQEYYVALEEGLTKAFAGEASPQKALDEVAAKWEKITKQLGRERQKEYYRWWVNNLVNVYPELESQLKK